MTVTLWPAFAGWLAAHWRELAMVSILLAAAYRERGSEHDWLGTQGARMLFWASPVTAAVWWLQPDLPLEALVRVWLAALLGMILLPHGAGQQLAGVPWSTPDTASGMDRIARPERLGYLWLAGLGRLAFLAAALDPWVLIPAGWMILGGLALPAGYLAGLAMPALPWRLRKPEEWGEFLSGGCLGLPLTLALTQSV